MQRLFKYLVTVDGVQYGWRYPNAWSAIMEARILFPGARGVFAKEIKP